MPKKTPQTTPLSPQTKRRLLLSAVIIVGILAVIAVAFASVTLAYKNKIYPHTMIGTTDFGGKTVDEAKSKLQDLTVHIPDNAPILVDGSAKAELPVKNAGLTYDVSSTATDLYAVGRSGNLAHDLADLVRSVFSRNHRIARFSLDSDRFHSVITTVLAQTNTPAVDAKIELKDGTPVITSSKSGSGLTEDELTSAYKNSFGTFTYNVSVTTHTLEPSVSDSQATYALEQTKQYVSRAPLTVAATPATSTIDQATLFSWLTYSLKNQSDIPALATPTPTPSIQPSNQAFIEKAHAALTPQVLVATIDTNKVKDFLANFSNGINKDPVNAKVGAKDGKVVVLTPHQDGKRIKLDEAATSIITWFNNPTSQPNQTLNVPVDVVPAEIQESTIDKLGLKELIGTASTTFVGSPDNRIHNITIGANFLNGVIVGKDQEFSTIKTLGKIDGAAGYLPELVIKQNQTVPDFGGGLCQVSTTLFRSVLNAGLPVTARTNHSYRVSYYEPPVGLDATIFEDPDVDFKFKNDSPGDILIQSKVEGTKITFELYGTKDGRASTISDSVVTDVTAPPPDIRTDTDTLPKGTVKQTDHAHPGANATVTYTVMRDGKQINQQVFHSHYVAWPARFLVGTKEG